MKTKEEWCQLFETVVGRIPTEIEVLAAEKSSFDPKAIIPISEGKIFEKSTVEEVTVTDDILASTSPLQNGAMFDKTLQNQKMSEKFLPKPSKEIIALPIISFVVSGLTLLLSMVVNSSWILLIMSLASLTLGIVSLAVNFKKTKKVLSIIALPLSIGALVVAGSVGIYHSAVESIESVFQRSLDDSLDDDFGDVLNDEVDTDFYVDTKAPFQWTEEKFRSLDFESDEITSYLTPQELIDKYGKANEATYSEGYLDFFYSGKTDEEYVNLTFWQNELGDWILDSGAITIESKGIETIPEESYQSTWTEKEFDQLIEADYERPELGSTWKEIHSKYGHPTFGEYTLANYGDGFTKNLNLYYTDLSADEGKLSEVNLYFTEKEGEYFLTYKSFE